MRGALLVLWSLPGYVLWSKAAKALSTTPVKRRDFCRASRLVESGQGPFDNAPSKGVTFAGLAHPSPTILVCQDAGARL
jgi:hypothetical protein